MLSSFPEAVGDADPEAVGDADGLVAHNVDFDLPTVGAELVRISGADPLEGAPALHHGGLDELLRLARQLRLQVAQIKTPSLIGLYSRWEGISGGARERTRTSTACNGHMALNNVEGCPGSALIASERRF